MIKHNFSNKNSKKGMKKRAIFLLLLIILIGIIFNIEQKSKKNKIKMKESTKIETKREAKIISNNNKDAIANGTKKSNTPKLIAANGVINSSLATDAATSTITNTDKNNLKLSGSNGNTITTVKRVTKHMVFATKNSDLNDKNRAVKSTNIKGNNPLNWLLFGSLPFSNKHHRNVNSVTSIVPDHQHHHQSL